MADNVEKVIAGFVRLSYLERSSVIELINEFQNADTSKREVLTENFSMKANLGPTNHGGCPCCGK